LSSPLFFQGRAGTGKAGAFTSDNKDKEQAASGAVQSAAKTYLYPIYEKCMAAAAAHDVVHPVLQV
jgi:hypothetical protein